jgi:DNA-binding MarR family transcriptional regulator
MIDLGRTNRGRAGVDLEILLRTRLLIQGNSGAGKSWLIRRLAEQLFSHVPVLIVDPEGEFATLRERFGYVLVGKGGETPADVRSAELVAHKLQELSASAVCDLYEMRPLDRHRWVKLFLEGLIDAPKKSWHPTVVIVDEAHLFCPEKGTGESDAYESMIDIATRGRKRGICAVFATQRLGKLRKDAAAELLNVLIGSTFIDIDRDRAADILGITRADRMAFFNEIRLLEPGNFWGLGRAIGTERHLIKIGPVQTSHPEAGSAKHSAAPPPPPERIKALLPKLKDLPQQAEEKAKTEAELRQAIRELKAQLAQQPVAKVATREVPILKDAQISRLEKLVGRLEAADHAAQTAGWARGEEVRAAAKELAALAKIQPAPAAYTAARGAAPSLSGMSPETAIRRGRGAPEIRTALAPPPSDLPKGELACLTAIAQHPSVTRAQLTVLTGYKRSTRDAYIQRLNERKLLSFANDRVLALPAAYDALGHNFQRLPEGAELQEYWLRRLPQGESEILDLLLQAYPKAVERERISEHTNYKRSTRDAYIQRLSARELVTTERDGVRAAEHLF